LYIIYIFMTLLQIILLVAGGMPLFDGVVYSFGTAGTGGFGTKGDSVAGYTAYQQWVITVFMLLFSVNFNLYYLILIKKFKAAFKSTELWFFAGLVGVCIIAITTNTYNFYSDFSEAIRHSSFQVASIVSTTGYSTVDFNTWPEFSKALLLMLMLIGGCAGSTAGGLKVSRVVILLKSICREFKKLLHPRSVKTLNMESKRLDENTLNGVNSYFAMYLIVFVVIYILISLEPFDMQTNFTAVLACFNNVGPGLGAVGPAANFSGYSDFAKLLLSVAMLLGRLEIFPLIIGLNPMLWRRR